MITQATTLTELAAIVSDVLEREGIVATLSGGAAVSIYSENRYVSEDLDFVTIAPIKELRIALEPLGFKHTGTPLLIASAVWNDAQSLEQALLVAEHQRDSIEWEELDQWVARESISGHKEIVMFYKKIGRPLPA